MPEYITREEHNEFEKRIEAENDRQNHRLTKLETDMGDLSKLTISVEKMAVNMERMVKEQEKTSSRLTSLEQEPADKWRKFAWAIFIAVAGAVVGAALGRFGL